MLYEHVNKYFKRSKADKALDKRLLGHDKFLTPIAIVFQTKTMDTIANELKSNVLRSTSMYIGSQNDPVVTIEATLCTNPRLLLVPRAITRRAMKGQSHAKPASARDVATIEAEATIRAS